jgi:hypothetical protein
MSNIINLTSFGLVWDTQDHMWEDLQSNYRKLLQHIVSQKYKKRQKVKIASSHVVYLYKNSNKKVFQQGLSLKKFSP